MRELTEAELDIVSGGQGKEHENEKASATVALADANDEEDENGGGSGNDGLQGHDDGFQGKPWPSQAAGDGVFETYGEIIDSPSMHAGIFLDNVFGLLNHQLNNMVDRQNQQLNACLEEGHSPSACLGAD